MRKTERRGAMHQSCFPTSNDLILRFPTSSRSSEVEGLASKQCTSAYCETTRQLLTITTTGKKEKGVSPCWQMTLVQRMCESNELFPLGLRHCKYVQSCRLALRSKIQDPLSRAATHRKYKGRVHVSQTWGHSRS